MSKFKALYSAIHRDCASILQINTYHPKKSCKICGSRYEKRVDELLITTNNLPKAYTFIAKEFDMTRNMVKKHASHAIDKVSSEESYGPKILGKLDHILNEASDIIDEARHAEAYSAALNGIKIIGGLLETQAKLLGLLSPNSSKSVHVHVAVPPEEVAKMADDYRKTVVDLEPSEREPNPDSDD